MSLLQKINIHLMSSMLRSCCQPLHKTNACFNLTQTRTRVTSFLVTSPAEDLWRSTITVSNAGKKRGRGRGAGRKKVKDFNRGQIFGVGKVNMVWPGLNSPVIRGKEVVTMTKLPENTDYAENLIKYRNELDVYKKIVMPPLERGWSGNKILGRWLGPPDPIDGEEFPNFNTKIVLLKSKLKMTGSLGKIRMLKVMAITGNKNGAAGFGIAEGSDQWDTIRLAVRRAVGNLISCHIHDGHTITHDFYSRVEHVRVFAHKKPPGFGVVAHRAIAAICNCIGIKDIFVSIEGPKKNYQNVVRAFFIGLIKQKTYQELADEKNLHLVEFREERDYFPVVVASPSSGYVRKKEEILPEEVMDFHMHLYNGLIKVQKAPKLHPFVRSHAYAKYLQLWHRLRNRQDVRIYLRAKHGAVESFLNVREREEREKRKALLAKESTASEGSVESVQQ